MKEKTTKIIKGIGKTITIGGLVVLSYIGLGNILTENYYDPGRGFINCLNCANRSWDLTASLFRNN